jgi:malonyl-CoA/methylmalonyl-CoA synthetase
LVLWATPELATVVGLFAAMACGRLIVPLNPKSGERELDHVLNDARVSALLAGADASLPVAAASLQRFSIEIGRTISDSDSWPSHSVAQNAKLIMYTSGTTGPPKGVVLSLSAVQSNLEALAEVWQWTNRDHLVHALPLHHVHGLILGLLGPIFVGGSIEHLGQFSVDGVIGALGAGGTMFFGVPTMYHRLANALAESPGLPSALAGTRLLVSGSGPLMMSDYQRIKRASGKGIVERYGMTETLIISSTDLDSAERPGYVGRALPSVRVRVVDEKGVDVPTDDETIGTVLVQSPSLFTGYLQLPKATKASMSDGWFSTGDLGVMSSDGWLRLLGRSSSDLIKSGGFRVGAGEVEQALLEHPSVEDVAVKGVPDDDLGERIVAWVVPVGGADCDPHDLIDYVATTLAPHKRPREIVFVSSLPRNDLGKLQKNLLMVASTGMNS